MTIDLNQLIESPCIYGAGGVIIAQVILKILHGYGIAVPALEKLAKLWSIAPCSKVGVETPKAEPTTVATDTATTAPKFITLEELETILQSKGVK